MPINGGPDHDLAETIDQFDRVDANVAKLEKIWREIREHIPEGICFGLDTAESDDLIRSFTRIADELPSIDGYKVDAIPQSLDEISQARFDAIEVDELELKVAVEQGVSEPGRQVAEYRYRLDRTRKALVRNRAMDVVSHIDVVLRDTKTSEGLGEWRGEDRWDELSDLASELDRLVGNTVPGVARWTDLRRHLRFAQSNDLSDIVNIDWPSVRAEVETSLYGEREPLPVMVDDLGALARTRPTGPVSTRLNWSVLSDEDFEAFVLELVRQAPGYENANWLMRTHAPDRGRDIEAYRVVRDALAGTKRYRVVIQCKHWLSSTVGPKIIRECLDSARLWEPPLVDVLVIATSGRFSQDAVAQAEKRNHERAVPSVELWPDSHLESLLSRRPSVATSYGLR